MRICLVVLCVSVSIVMFGCGGSDSEDAVLTVVGRYLMAFHSCDTTSGDCSNPNGHVVRIAQSDDGASWSVISDFVATAGSVPDVIRRGDTLYLFGGGNQLHTYNFKKGEWKFGQMATFRNQDGSTALFTDLCPILDDQNRIVFFTFLGNDGGVDPASSGNGQTRNFISATEVDGSDGTEFVVDDGVRASVTFPIGSGTDPDIFRDPSGYVMYVSHGNNVAVYTSPDLRGSFTLQAALPDGYLSQNLGGVPAGHYDFATGQYWTYVNTSQFSAGQSQPAVIRRAVHSSLTSQLSDSEFVTVLSGAQVPGLNADYSAESPGFAVNE